jgi:elongator complex protein 4
MVCHYYVFRSAEEYCGTLDLTSQIPGTVVEGKIYSKELHCIDLASEESGESLSTSRIISQLARLLETERLTPLSESSEPLRICIPSLASPQWGDLRDQVCIISPKAVLHV